jgi:Tfp pilus assembly protein PilX
MRGPEADRGQALVFALIVVLVAILVPTVMVSNLQRQIPVVTSEMNFDAALAATQAGIQSYRNLLNAYPSYWQYNSSSTIPAGEGGANQALTGWETVPRSSPTESFTYSPDTSQLSAAAGGQLSGDVLLTVIGRAGTTGAQTSYRRIQAALSLSGVLTDVYYSNYEQPGTLDSDQWDQNVYPTGSTNQSSVCSANGSCSAEAYDEVTDNLSYAPVGSPTPSVATTTESASTALCLYDAYQPNQFIDWYSQYKSPIYPPSGGGYPNSSTAYNTTTNQYYGPWYGTFSDPLSSGYQFGLTGNPSLGSCNVNYWITGDSFNGPVYSQDELTTCGQPTFTGTPSLQTAVSKLFDFPANWPGTKPASGGFSNPYGYVQDPFGICGSSDTPTFNDPLSPRFAVNQSLPPLANELKSEIEQGTVAGCVYTGPTAIRFYWNPSTSTEQMVVWSPLTQVTFASLGANCGSWPTTQPAGTANPGSPQVTGAAPGTVQTSQGLLQVVPVTQPLVIYVQNTPTWVSSLGTYQSQDPNAWQTLPNAETNATVAGCIDPFVNSGPTGSVNQTTCDEGDTMLSGTLGHGTSSGGQITVDSESSNVISHSLVYDCGLTGSGNWPTYSSSLGSCASSLDVLGLVANNNTWLAHPVSASGGQLSACTDDYDMPAPGDTFSGTPPTPSVPARAAGDVVADAGEIDFNDMIPTLCDQKNPILDAAEASLQGFFEVQNWREGDASGGTLYFNGSTAVNNAGQYGVFGGGGLTNGYLLNLTYDLRLRYLVPPSFIQATASVWSVVDWTTCGNSGYSAPASAAVATCKPLPT